MFRKVASIPLWVDNAEKDKTYQTTTLKRNHSWEDHGQTDLRSRSRSGGFTMS